jgi:predicted 3-demethylubiquinone-9 3-methyltransferase (glyoxalase superfamily)
MRVLYLVDTIFMFVQSPTWLIPFARSLTTPRSLESLKQARSIGHIMEFSAKVRTCFWFDNKGHEAAEFYVSLLPNSYLENRVEPSPDQPPRVVEFTLGGTPYMILNGGPRFTPNEAASISVLTEDQEETDRLWNLLLADGGQEGRCGWLKDKYGVSWQIVPKKMPQLLSSEDKEAAGRVVAAMMEMNKIDIAALETAFNNADGA